MTEEPSKSSDQEREGERRTYWVPILLGVFFVGLIIIVFLFAWWQLTHPPEEKGWYPSSEPEPLEEPAESP